MKEYRILPYNKLFELFNILNRQNISDSRAVAIREINVSSIEKMRISSQNLKPGYTSFVAKATALVLTEMPNANRATIESFFYKRIYQFLTTHISVAVERNDVDEEAGTAFVYTIYNTDQKKLKEISQEISGLSQSTLDSQDPRLERWRRMKEGIKIFPFIWIIRLIVWLHKNIPSLHIKNRGGAAMISSPSKYGVDFIVANWPYTLGISFGLAKDRPWVIDNKVVVQKTMSMTLSFDRRLVSGANAARFLNRLCEILENAEKFID